ncbi:phospholipase A2, membrane associated-like [Erythrolamprus reginae]|uniref:phospholipase A2, membrane associated-like n=1 Tax=Erythrolamprus reginae TaxID=121349 RepID=UPI00396C8BEC
MGPSILLLCLLASVLTTTHGSLVQLHDMITKVTGKSAVPFYSSYGCHCGIGGRGTPKDATDSCCRRHDCCYDGLVRSRCSPKTTRYSFSYRQGQLQCGRTSNRCQASICSCDRTLALCLKRNVYRYQKKYTYYWNALCKGTSPRC